MNTPMMMTMSYLRREMNFTAGVDEIEKALNEPFKVAATKKAAVTGIIKPTSQPASKL